MSQSISPQCTSLKHAYDACFNAWFEGYLEPAVAIANGNGKNTDKTNKETYSANAKQKAEEFDARCGKLWKEYKSCIQVAVKEKGLDKLLDLARQENPLVDPIPPPASNSPAQPRQPATK